MRIRLVREEYGRAIGGGPVRVASMEDIEKAIDKEEEFSFVPKESTWTREEMEVLAELTIRYLKKNKPDEISYTDSDKEGSA